jgi:hypothetical protein
MVLNLGRAFLIGHVIRLHIRANIAVWFSPVLGCPGAMVASRDSSPVAPSKAGQTKACGFSR